MRAVAANPPRLTFDYEALTSRIRALLVTGETPPQGASVVDSCFHLDEIAKRFPTTSGNALEWDVEDQVLSIHDPYLLFYLRWSEHVDRESMRGSSDVNIEGAAATETSS